MIAAAPEGSPPRRISNKQLKKIPAPPCLGEALRRGSIVNITIFMDSGVNTLFMPVYTVPFSLIPFPNGTIARKCIYDEPIIFRNYGAPMKNSLF